MSERECDIAVRSFMIGLAVSLIASALLRIFIG